MVTLVQSGSILVLEGFLAGETIPEKGSECLNRHSDPEWKESRCQKGNKYPSVHSSKVEDFNLCVVHTVHLPNSPKEGFRGSKSLPRLVAEVLETWAMCTEAT